MLLLNLALGAALLQGDDETRRLMKARDAINAELAAMDRFANSSKTTMGVRRGNRLFLSKLPIRASATALLDVEVRSYAALTGKSLTGATAAEALVAALKKEGAVKTVVIKMLKPMDPLKKTPDVFQAVVRYTAAATGAEYVDSWTNSDGSCWVVERKAVLKIGG
jgi:hypothetical protein